jgi:hypothetical protein
LCAEISIGCPRQIRDNQAMKRSQSVVATFVILLSLDAPARALPQTVEIAPFGGYRFGGDFFELATNGRLDVDGAPALGALVNIEMWDGLWFEGFFTHQHAHVDARLDPFSPPVRVRADVDHWLAGGRQDVGNGRVRPFLTGLIGLTRFGAGGDNEIRFTAQGGGGLRLLPQHKVGVRLDARVYSTFVDVDARAIACGPGTCLTGLNIDVVWQIETTAGVVFVF